MPTEERPREKLQMHGAGALSNAELLAILLRTGSSRSRRCSWLCGCSPAAGVALFTGPLTRRDGGDQRSGTGQGDPDQGGSELGRRLATLPPDEAESITSPQRAAALFMEQLRYKRKEHFMILLLNTKNHVISKEEISIGSLNASIVHPREIFNIPLRKSAASVILVHNHPSGDPSPSQEDLEVTRRLVEAGNILGIAVRDHLVIGDGCYFSFKEKGLL